jgi:DNA-binding CsgD family transcriptional regulator
MTTRGHGMDSAACAFALAGVLRCYHAAGALPGVLAVLGPHLQDNMQNPRLALVPVEAVADMHQLLPATLSGLIPEILQTVAPWLRDRPRINRAGQPAVTVADHTPNLLSGREVQVLEGVSRGLTNEQIGRELFLSPHTVKQHIRRLAVKLGARDRAQAVNRGWQTGVLRSASSERAA